MPELAEVKIMADFINMAVENERFFDVIEKSPVSKVKTELDPFGGGVFTLQARSRGKELMLHMELIGGDLEGATTKNLLCTMGMSGNWVLIRKDSAKLEEAMKHAHLRLQSVRGNWLILYDPRRFAKWKWVDGWTNNRGPCPLTEFNDFSEYLRSHWYTHKDFKSHLSVILMSQKWFNGIGNYLRAEILYRLDVNPFQPANQITQDDLDELVKLCFTCVKDAYYLGGGQLKDWHNPIETDATSFKEWIKCYGKLSNIVDATGRRFWYDPKWEIEDTTK